MKVLERLDLSRIGKTDDYNALFDRFAQGAKRVFENITQCINGGISFGNGIERDNIDGRWFNTVTGPADTEFTLSHLLGRVPIGYIIVMRDQPAIIYDGLTAWTPETISLRCNMADVLIRGFII